MPPLLETAMTGARSKHFPRGQIIMYQSDVPYDVIVLEEGVVKIHDIDEQGNEKILHLLKPYAILPFAFFSGGKDEMRWFYTALTDCDVRVMPMSELMKRMEANCELTLYLMHWFSDEVHELLTRLSSLGKTNSHDKIMAALKFLALNHAKERRSGWWRIAIPVNHQLIADMVGVTRENTAMVMKEFTRQGIVRNPRQTILEVNVRKLINS